MRDYLFRGQAISDKQWVYGSLIINDNRYFILPSKTDDYIYDVGISDNGRIVGYVVPVIPETVGQYTNMNDVDGHMIFEGDILQFGVHRLIVYWDEESFQWAAKKKRGWDIIHFRHNYPRGFWNSIDLGEIAAEEIITGRMTTVVIGNIFDNPDLIEDETNADSSEISYWF